MTETQTAHRPGKQSTSYEVRAEFESLLDRDLLGPVGRAGRGTASRGVSPAERYLLGRLVPQDAPADEDTADDDDKADDPALVEREVSAGTDDEDDDTESEAAVRAGSHGRIGDRAVVHGAGRRRRRGGRGILGPVRAGPVGDAGDRDRRPAAACGSGGRAAAQWRCGWMPRRPGSR